MNVPLALEYAMIKKWKISAYNISFFNQDDMVLRIGRERKD